MINKIKNNQHHQGQVAIIVLLASAILLTLGLSASRKTITDTKIDTDEELLKEAFNTAESGINNYINTGSASYSDSSGGNATINSSPIGNSNSISSEGLVSANSSQSFWLVGHNADGTINLNDYYTGNTVSLSVDSDFAGAVKIDYFYLDASSVYRVQHLGYNFKNSNTINNFTDSASNTVTLTLPSGKPLLITVTPIAASSQLTVSGSAFPLQGEEITAVGTAGNGVKTQIKTRNIYQIPSFFFESITAGNIIQ